MIRAREQVPGASAILFANGPTGRRLTLGRVVAAIGGPKDAAHLVVGINDAGVKIATNASNGLLVAVDPDILLRFQDKGLHRIKTGMRIVTNAPHRVALGEDAASRLGPLLTSPSVLFGRDDWPALACGPLAVWTVLALGFTRIYLVGFDGTFRAPAEFRRRSETWEQWIRSWRRARAHLEGRDALREERAVKFFRVWPRDLELRRGEVDPLAEIVEPERVFA